MRRGLQIANAGRPTLLPYVPSLPAGCGTPEQDVDLWDADITTVKAKTLADCFSACAATAGCGAFTLVASWGECYLKSAKGFSRQSLKGAQSVVVVPCKKASAASSATSQTAGHPGRRLAGADAASLRPLALPGCAYGTSLNFVGSWAPADRKVRPYRRLG